jgi:hypothetical protein
MCRMSSCPARGRLYGFKIQWNNMHTRFYGIYALHLSNTNTCTRFLLCATSVLNCYPAFFLLSNDFEFHKMWRMCDTDKREWRKQFNSKLCMLTSQDSKENMYFLFTYYLPLWVVTPGSISLTNDRGFSRDIITCYFSGSTKRLNSSISFAILWCRFTTRWQG